VRKGQDPGDCGGRRLAGEPVIAALSLSDPGPPEIKSPKQPSEQTPHGSASLRPYPGVLTPSRTERLSGSGHRLGEPSRPPEPRDRMGSACGPKALHAAPKIRRPLCVASGSRAFHQTFPAELAPFGSGPIRPLLRPDSVFGSCDPDRFPGSSDRSIVRSKRFDLPVDGGAPLRVPRRCCLPSAAWDVREDTDAGGSRQQVTTNS
jgi:hypothetical protein